MLFLLIAVVSGGVQADFMTMVASALYLVQSYADYEARDKDAAQTELPL